MLVESNFVKGCSRYLTIIVLCSGSSFSEPTAVRANQTLEQSNSSNSSTTFDQNKVTVTNFRVVLAAIDPIEQHEGFRSYAYMDSNGLPVLGYGLTIITGRAVVISQYITQTEAEAALLAEIEQIQRSVSNTVRVNLNANQLAALTSLVYNAGTRVITQSTLSRKLNSGDYVGAARKFPGLTKRRINEQNLFLTPVASNIQPQ